MEVTSPAVYCVVLTFHFRSLREPPHHLVDDRLVLLGLALLLLLTLLLLAQLLPAMVRQVVRVWVVVVGA